LRFFTPLATIAAKIPNIASPIRIVGRFMSVLLIKP